MVKDLICSIAAVSVVTAVLFSGCSPSVGQVSEPFVPSDPEEIEVYQPAPKPVVVVSKREKLQKIYLSQVGVREKTGRNDGKDVEKYLKAVNLGKGYAWCAAFVRWCFDQADIITPITAWSPTAHNPNSIIYAKGKWKNEMQRGDVFTLYYAKHGRIGHTGFVNKMTNEKMVETCEGNTNSLGSREGDGVYLKYRPIKTIHSITSWVQ